MSLLLVQMSGCPGAGKSTLAALIRRETGAVVLDLDVTKSQLLDGGVPFADAGELAYRAIWCLTEALLSRGSSVVIDSPCYHQEVLDQGLRLAEKHGAGYKYVECVLTDLDELERRLRARTPLRSQRPDVETPPVDLEGQQDLPPGRPLFRQWIRNMKRPRHAWLEVDTSRDLDACWRQVLRYLAAPAAPPPNRAKELA